MSVLSWFYRFCISALISMASSVFQGMLLVTTVCMKYGKHGEANIYLISTHIIPTSSSYTCLLTPRSVDWSVFGFVFGQI